MPRSPPCIPPFFFLIPYFLPQCFGLQSTLLARSKRLAAACPFVSDSRAPHSRTCYWRAAHRYTGVSGEVRLVDSGKQAQLAIQCTQGWRDTVLWNPYGDEGARSGGGVSPSQRATVLRCPALLLPCVESAVGGFE